MKQGTKDHIVKELITAVIVIVVAFSIIYVLEVMKQDRVVVHVEPKCKSTEYRI